MTTRLTHPISRRAALSSLGAGAVGIAMATTALGRAEAFAQDATAEATVSTEPNVSYGEIDGQHLMLDIYRPILADGARPGVLLFHPGGMMDGDRTWMSDAAAGLAEAGYVAFAVGYRLFDGVDRNLWPAQLDDAQRAVRWVRANAATYDVDPDRLASYGHSSGAQLAAFLGSRDTRDDTDATLAGLSSRVACVVDMAGTMDPETDADLASWAAILSGTADAPPDQAAYRDFSPITFVDKTTAPFLILQGGADSASRIEESRRMEAALREAGVEVVYGEFPGLDHFVWDWAHSGAWTLAFLDQHLHPNA